MRKNILGDLTMAAVLVGAFFALGATRPEFDVTSYGAIPDDGADDRVAINSAIQDAAEFTNANANQRAVLIFPRGIYHLDTTAAGIPVAIEGDRITVAADGAVITKSVDGIENQFIYVTGDDVVIQGLAIDGAQPTQISTGTGHGINTIGKRTRYERVIVRNTRGAAFVDGQGAEDTVYKDCQTYDTFLNGIRSRGNRTKIIGGIIQNWDLEDIAGGRSGITCDSQEAAADDLLIDGVRLVMPSVRNASEAILVDGGDIPLEAANSGEATNVNGKAAWTIDAGHAYQVGDGFYINGSGETIYDGPAGLGIMHKITDATGNVFVRSTGATTFKLYTTAAEAVANGTPIALGAGFSGTVYVKTPGVPRRTIASVDTDNEEITVDTTHNFKDGALCSLTRSSEAATLPAGLAGAATIVTNTNWDGSGTGANTKSPISYDNVTLRDVIVEYWPSDTEKNYAIKVINTNRCLFDHVEIYHPGETAGVDCASVQIGEHIRKLAMRNCRFGGKIVNNKVGLVPDWTIDNCEIGADQIWQDYGIETLQPVRFVMRDTVVRFGTYAIGTGGGDTDPTQWREADIELVDIQRCTFEANRSGAVKALILQRVYNNTTPPNGELAHLARSGYLRWFGNTVRNLALNSQTVTFSLPSGSLEAAGQLTICSASNNCLQTGDQVRFSTTGALPTLITTDGIYYVRKRTADQFTIHSTLSGALTDTDRAQADPTAMGNGTHSVISSKSGITYTSGNLRDLMFRQTDGSGRSFFDEEAPTPNGVGYRPGDKIWRENPLIGMSPGWICTSGGVVGSSAATWKQMLPDSPLVESSTPVNNSGTGETDLFTYHIADTNQWSSGQLFGTNGEKLEFDGLLSFVANTNTKRLRIYIQTGGSYASPSWSSAIYDSTALAQNGGLSRLRFTMTRTSNAAQAWVVQVFSNDGATLPSSLTSATTSRNTDSTNGTWIRVTGQSNMASDDISLVTHSLRSIPAP